MTDKLQKSGKTEYFDKLRNIKKDKAKTIYNPGNALYNKLTKFFSGPITKYKVPDNAAANRRTVQKYNFQSLMGEPFKKTDEYYILNQAQSEQNQEALRLERYIEFEALEMAPPEIKVALDIYADEITCYTEFSPIIKIISPKDEIKEILHTLFYDTLNVQMNLFRWVREVCKFGDFFLFLDIDPKSGVVGTKALPVFEIQRLEGEDPSNPNYVQFQWNAENLTFENVEIAHFRILGNDRYYPYGSSVLDPARKIAKQLNLMIEHMMTYRIVRSSERKVFYYDVTGLEPKDIETFLEKAVSKVKRQPIVNSKNGQIDMRYDVLSIEQDYHIPVKKGTETRIDSLPGGQFTGDIEDVEFLRDQLFTALKIPGSYLTNKNTDGEQNSLAQKSMLFAKEILRIQNSIVAELRKIAMVHLLTLGYSGKDILSFDIKLNNPSKLAEMQEFEHLKLKAEAASLLSDHNLSKRWIQSKIFGFSPDEIKQNVYEILGDAKFQAILSNIENQMSGGGGDELGGGLGGGGIGDLGSGLGAGSSDNFMSDAGAMMNAEPGAGAEAGGETPEANPEAEFQQLGGEETKPAARRSSPLVPKSLAGRNTEGSNGHAYFPKHSDGRANNGRKNTYRSTIGNKGAGFNSLFGEQNVSNFIENEYLLSEKKNEISEEENIINSIENSIQETNDFLANINTEKKELINKSLSKYDREKVIKKFLKRK
jgi:hypothetical protein